MEDTYDLTLITEAFNLADGQSFAALQRAMTALIEIAAPHSAEVLVTDGNGDERVRAAAAEHGARLRYLDARGYDYDAQKNFAATEARGRWLVYLDGDCSPLREDWLEKITAPLRDGSADIVGGLTLYDDPSPTGIAATVMDFGYVWDDLDGGLGCYSSNNVAFLRPLRCAIPIPESDLRCNCYAHTQLILRAGKRARFAPEAVASHEMPDADKERHRRGWDLVAACWSNPMQVEASQLYATRAALEWQLNRLQYLDAMRLARAPAAVGLRDDNRAEVQRELARLRRIEAIGIRDALQEGERNGRNAEARAAYADWQRAMALSRRSA